MQENKKILSQNLFRKFLTFVIKHYTFFRLTFFVINDFSITFVSFIAAIYIYTRIIYIPYQWWMIYTIISIAFLAKIICFAVFRIYDISFQYASILYIIKTSSVIFIAAVLNYFLLKLTFPSQWFLAISTLEFLFDIIGSISFRFLPLIYYELCNRVGQENQNCFIYGCGDTGKSLIPVLIKNKIRIKGFIDDDPRNLNKVINGVKVLGKIEDLEEIVNKIKIDELIIANPSLDGKKTKHVKYLCSKLNVNLKTIPSLIEIYNKDIEEIVTSIRHINYDDLIRRPVQRQSILDLDKFFDNKKIMITGIGSIGSELINQLINFKPQEIIALDNSELNLFNLENSIDEKKFKKINMKLIDLKNRGLLEKIFAESRPDIVFNTAAYKHVPIVEQNVCEGVLNNLLCLKNVYEISKEKKVKRFIFISSDKAVRPTNIMGATKRLGELYIQAMNARDEMVSCSVRFGNVIGSSGSLIPKIIKQIKSNGTVTVTHPEASRFFMLVSEAVLLILKASILAKGGEIFILDMGKPIKIVDMVRDVITFYGKIPDLEVPIKYIGLRPGEKLFEELFLDKIEQNYYKDGMYIAEPDAFDYEDFLKSYNEILSFSSSVREREMTNLIKKYVTMYTNEQLLKEAVK